MAEKPTKKRPRDLNLLARSIVLESVGETLPEVPSNKNPHAVALGKLGGKKGGKARTEKLTPERRQEIARKAAQSRWKDRSS